MRLVLLVTLNKSLSFFSLHFLLAFLALDGLGDLQGDLREVLLQQSFPAEGESQESMTVNEITTE